MKCSELIYNRDSSKLFAVVAAEPWSMFLDSAYPDNDSGRYDIIVARPLITFETKGNQTLVTTKTTTTTTTDDPFNLIKQYLGNQAKNHSGLPFCGGAVGYFGYDLGRKIETLPVLAKQDIDLPELAVGIYDWAVIVDHHVRRTWLVSFCRFAETIRAWQTLQTLFADSTIMNNIKSPPLAITTQIKPNMTKAQYHRAFDRIKDYIGQGDCYQVNLAQRFSAQFTGNSWDVYRRLRQLNPAPFSAYIHLQNGAVLSSSPERFLKIRDQQVETKPIKGTIHRSVFAYEDKALATSLLESAKDRAENLMIVDLLRNDISKLCVPGSVVVPQLFALESYATVHHLVSTITGRLTQTAHAIELLRACFPGGSITGAPKLRAMEIIEELEPHRRSVYCGSIAYLGFDGNMDSNICIRTLLHDRAHLYFYAGGGIVWDSNVQAEYDECFTKAAALFKLFKSHAH